MRSRSAPLRTRQTEVSRLLSRQSLAVLYYATRFTTIPTASKSSRIGLRVHRKPLSVSRGWTDVLENPKIPLRSNLNEAPSLQSALRPPQAWDPNELPLPQNHYATREALEAVAGICLRPDRRADTAAEN